MNTELRSNNLKGRYNTIEPVLVFDRQNSGTPNGMVHQKFVDGSEYHGEVQNSKFAGKGCYKFANGDTYFGEFANDQINGSGVIFYTRFSDRYEGEFTNGKRNGVGVYFRGNSETYEGEFRDNFREGLGMYTFRNGDSYKGYYKLGLEDGHSVYTSASGESEAGEWTKGVQKSYTFRRPDPSNRVYQKTTQRVNDIVSAAQKAADKGVDVAGQAENMIVGYRESPNSR